jgi:hypothetical protein
MFSVIRAHQLKALNFQLQNYVSDEQNYAERPVCLSVCRKKFFLIIQVQHRYQLNILQLLIKIQGTRNEGPKIHVQ